MGQTPHECHDESTMRKRFSTIASKGVVHILVEDAGAFCQRLCK